MKANHPDLGGDTDKAAKINEAQELLESVVEQVEYLNLLDKIGENDTISTIIPLNELVEIYKGKELTLRNEDGELKLTRKNLGKHRVFIDISCKIEFNGLEYKFNALRKVNLAGEYTMNCIVNDVNIKDEREVRVRAFKKDIKIKLKGAVTAVVLNFDNLVKLRISIERRVSDG